MKRYDHEPLSGRGMVEAQEGIYCVYTDHKAEIEKLKKEIEEYQGIYLKQDNMVQGLKKQNKELLYALNDMALMVNPFKKNEEGMTKYTKAMDLIEKIEKIEKENKDG